MRRNIVAANWKMNKDVQESYDFTKSLSKKLLNLKRTHIILCPPFTSLFYISELLKNSSIALGGQNMHYEKSGAFTGEISASMLKSSGCDYVILGHSERRHVFNESNELIKKKIDTALSNDLKPIICVGEKLEERQSGKTSEVIRTQYSSAFIGISEQKINQCIIAYEPVWAIGTGITATPEQASEVQGVIRNLVSEQYNREIADSMPILYGGSVKSANAKSLIETENIDGFLVGGASLVVDHFFEIINVVEQFSIGQEK
ncbi:MAG: triose-phosphate isomerase [Candidatus Neomarinimicrobiota bacterium]|nr:MAG: triose-phosphate isomerase [Candidatus Neomarinimicrobiota bacterium]